MIEVTGTAQLQAWRDRVMPPVEEVRPGLWSIPVPLPYNALRYVLVYVLECDGGVVLVDTGWNTEEAALALGAARSSGRLGPAGGTVSRVCRSS